MASVSKCAWGCEVQLPESPSGSEEPETDSPPNSDEVNEAKCADGSECARKCEEAFSSYEACFSDKPEKEFKQCTDCIRLDQLSNKLESGKLSAQEYRNRICAHTTTCARACGSCSEAVKEASKCAFDCDEDGLPQKPKGGFSQKIEVRLDGLSRVMTNDEIQLFIEATQEFLATKDPSAKVYFVSQKLVRGRRYQRSLQSSSLDVTTRVDSEEEENPGTKATESISNDLPNYANALRAQESDIFYAVQGVQAQDPVETPAPAPVPKSDGGGGSKKMLLWFGLVLLILSGGCAVFFCIKFKHIMESTSLNVDHHKSVENPVHYDRAQSDDHEYDGQYASPYSRSTETPDIHDGIY